MFSGFIPHCKSYLGLGAMEAGAFSRGVGRAKDEKGVSTKLAAPVYSHPNTMGDKGQAWDLVDIRAIGLRLPSLRTRSICFCLL